MVRYFVNATAFLITWCDCNLYVYRYMYVIWNRTSQLHITHRQSHRMGMEPIHMQHRTQKYITVTPFEQYH